MAYYNQIRRTFSVADVLADVKCSIRDTRQLLNTARNPVIIKQLKYELTTYLAIKDLLEKDTKS